MKKSICLIIINFMIMLYCYPLKCQALASTTVYLETNTDNITIGDEIEVKLILAEQKTSAYSIEIYFDKTKLEFISGPENSNVIGNKVKIVWYDSKGGEESKTGELEKIKFKAVDAGIAEIALDGEIFDENANSIETKFENMQIQIFEQGTNERKISRSVQKQDSVQLQSLMLNVEGIVPDFAPDIYEYDLTIPEQLKNIKDIEVLAKTENTNATIEVNGNKDLKEGLNIITILVTNQEKKQEYKIKVTKTKNIEMANANLENLAIEYAILSPEFSNQTIQYNTQVSNEINQLNILAIPENEQGKVEIIGNDNFNEGNNKVKIKVTAPNGFTQRIYEINVYKRNKQEEEVYNQEVSKVKQRLEDAYSVEKVLDENESPNIEQTNEEKQTLQKDYLLIAVDVFIIVAIAIGFNFLIKKTKNSHNRNIK